MIWNSPVDYTRSHKLKDPLMETIKPTENLTAVDILVRESIQNSLDAPRDKHEDSPPVQVAFTLKVYTDSERDDFLEHLCWSQLEPELWACQKFLSRKGKPKWLISEQEFTDHGSLPVLYVADYRTKGLLGKEFPPLPDTADAKGTQSFAALCRSEGDNEKESDGGGTHGFGKAALWKSSAVLTVLFDSVMAEPATEDGQDISRRFIGSARLLSRYLGEVHKNEKMIFGGDSNPHGVVSSARNDDARDVSASLGFPYRSEEDSGTTIAIVGILANDPDDVRMLRMEEAQAYLKDLSRAVQKWFWPAIAAKRLEVKIFLNHQLVEHINEVEMPELYPYVKALEAARSPDATSIPVIVPKGKTIESDTKGQVRVGISLLADNADKNDRFVNRVALIRGPLMVVGYHKFPRTGLSASNYVGVALGGKAVDRADPNQKAVDLLLALSEDVKHETWDQEGTNLKGWKGARARIGDIKRAIREAVQNRTCSLQEPESSGAPELSKLISLQGDAGLTAGHAVSVNRKKPLSRVESDSGGHIYEVAYELKIPGTKSAKCKYRVRKGRFPSFAKAEASIAYLRAGAGHDSRQVVSLSLASAQLDGAEVSVEITDGKALTMVPIIETDQTLLLRLRTIPIPNVIAASAQLDDACGTELGYKFNL